MRVLCACMHAYGRSSCGRWRVPALRGCAASPLRSGWSLSRWCGAGNAPLAAMPPRPRAQSLALARARCIKDVHEHFTPSEARKGRMKSVERSCSIPSGMGAQDPHADPICGQDCCAVRTQNRNTRRKTSVKKPARQSLSTVVLPPSTPTWRGSATAHRVTSSMQVVHACMIRIL